MTASIAAIIWCAGIVLWTIIRFPHRKKAKKTSVVTDRRSSAETIALTACIVGLVGIPAVHLILRPFQFADYSFVPAMAWIGLLAMGTFLLMFHLSHKHLAKNWSVTLEIRKDHKLVDTGIYSKIRHPMYTSFWLWGIAQALLLPNWIAGFAGLVSVAWLYFSRIDNEEAMMRQQFGAEYDDYCSRTNRLTPKFF